MSKRTRPNIVVVITDDHGYGDLGCFGSADLKTPLLDRLAAAGAVLTECYSNSPVCSPSRAAILRGQHPARTGVDDVIGRQRARLRRATRQRRISDFDLRATLFSLES
ncbi:MAG: sulfatase [Microbacteriaceae bacterium]